MVSWPLYQLCNSIPQYLPTECLVTAKGSHHKGGEVPVHPIVVAYKKVFRSAFRGQYVINGYRNRDR